MPAPVGIDARWAWFGQAGNGAGVKICDLEYSVNRNHTDLNAIELVRGPLDPTRDENHGTAVMGIIGGSNNGFGIKGIAYGASLYFASTLVKDGTWNIAAAITACADKLGAGDVIIIEQQIRGPNAPTSASTTSQKGLVPVEWDEENYDAIKLAVAKGITVIEAAGNGEQDLDSSDYQTGNGGHYPFTAAKDSGAIIVGAGNSPYSGSTVRSASWFSNYGATVDLQGWGDGIISPGYGDLHPGDNPPDGSFENEWYRLSFGGTSGASPIVASAAAIVQSTYKLVKGGPATPAQVKAFLRDTGTSQQGAKNIGPLPNLRDALLAVYANAGVNTAVAPPTISPPPGTYQMPMQVTIGYGSGQSGANTQIRYTLNGSEPTEDSFIFIPEQGDAIYLNYGATIKARAFQHIPAIGRTVESQSATATYASSTPKVETPAITPGGGTYNQGQQFVIATTTPGATIRYRTDGRAPSFFYPGTDYTGPITLPEGTQEIVARGYKDGFYKSDAAYSGDITIQPITLPTPTIYPNGGSFVGEVTVYMGTTVLGAEIRYTVDGSTPTASSPQFDSPISLIPVAAADTFTIKARIFLDGYTPSNEKTAVFTVTRKASPPLIDPNGGDHNDSVQITLTTADAGSVIRYTTNGATPTGYSAAYTGPFSLGVGQHTVKARAFLAGGQPSDVTSATFTVFDTSTPVTMPEMTPFSTQYFVEPFTVTMRTDTEGADIRYTFASDGSLPPDPTAASTLYSGPFQITSNGQYFFKAKAFSGASSSNTLQSGQLSLGNALGTATTPAISPPGGQFTDTVEAMLSGAVNEVFFYTLDGSEPVSVPPANPPSAQNNGLTPISIGQPTTVKAKAYRIFFASSGTAEADFTFICDTPVALTAAGVYTSPLDVELTTTTPSATIRYTLDGSEPVTTSTAYDGSPIPIGAGTTTLKAKCFRPSFDPSSTITELYVVDPTPPAPVIAQGPQSQSVAARRAVTFTVDATNVTSATVSVQWQLNGKDIAGADEPVHVVPAAQDGDAGEYRAIVRDRGGEVTSDAATLTLLPEAIAGLSAGNDGPTTLGEPTILTAFVTAGAGVTYQWNLGDGQSGAGPIVTHTYAQPGQYTATVTASNSLNQQQASTTVIVVDAVGGTTLNRSTYLPVITR